MKSIQIALSTIAFAVLGASATIAAAGEYMPAPEIERFVAQKSLEQVRVETLEAARSGLLARNEADVDRIASQGFQSLKTRTQVVVETREAARLGLIPRKDMDYALFAPTPAQLHQIAAAGLRAHSVELASS